MTDGSDAPWGPPELALVLSEFGRDAALRFCATLADLERQRIVDLGGTPFFDEYRRLTLALVGDLPFVKAPTLAPYRERGARLDESVLVGFPDGLPLERVAPRLGLLALEAMRGPVARGVERVFVLLPCNTLAGASRLMAEGFASEEALLALITRALPGRPALADELQQSCRGLLDRAELCFPTVPSAVIRAAEQIGGEALMPLGTVGILETYRAALLRCGSRLELVPPDGAGQQVVLEAIQASIAGDPAARGRARQSLERLVARAQEEHGDGIIVVEACTDLDYHVGLSSATAYAASVVDRVYS
jgi:hypothetical protein